MVEVRKSMKVSAITKDAVQDVKRKYRFKTESEAIYYLRLVETWALEKMPTKVYMEALALARDMHNQLDIADAIKRAQAAIRDEVKD